MKRKRFPEEQIIKILQEAESGVKTADLCRKYGMSDATFYNWKSKYGGLSVNEVRMTFPPKTVPLVIRV